jgi:hypothetical protein
MIGVHCIQFERIFSLQLRVEIYCPLRFLKAVFFSFEIHPKKTLLYKLDFSKILRARVFFFIDILILELFYNAKKNFTNSVCEFFLSRYKNTAHARIHSCYTKLVSFYLYIV